MDRSRTDADLKYFKRTLLKVQAEIDSLVEVLNRNARIRPRLPIKKFVRKQPRGSGRIKEALTFDMPDWKERAEAELEKRKRLFREGRINRKQLLGEKPIKFDY